MNVSTTASADTGVQTTARWERWNRTVLFGLAAIAATLPIVNVAVDPFDLFMLSPIGSGPYLNQRFHHAERLRSAAESPEVLVLGDSIMGINDPSTLLTGSRFHTAYNASVFMASAADIREMASFVARLQRKPKLVIVGLDTYMFSGQPQPDSFSIKMPPAISGQTAAQWWTQALFAPGLFPAYDKAVEKIKGLPSAVFDTVHGHYSRPQLDNEIEADPVGYAQRIFIGVPKATGRIATSDAQLSAIGEAASRMNAAGLETLWVLQPPSYGLSLMYSAEAIEANRAAIAARLPPEQLLDLTSMRDVTADATAWYDLKHYRPTAGRAITSAIAKRIASSKLTALPDADAK